ncbi:hypothetical protein [Azospirillum largimobile]
MSRKGFDAGLYCHTASPAGTKKRKAQMTSAIRLGDFTELAADYARYRQGYSDTVLSALLGMMDRPAGDLDAVDVGAGTGIWTRMLEQRGWRSVIAVEPNDAMRTQGIAQSRDTRIDWRAGSGEATGLPEGSCDFVSMASSFHWVDFERGTAEFARILRPGGRFVALWNPRAIEDSPLLMEIEGWIGDYVPGLTRVSSGRGGSTEALMNRLAQSPHYEDMVYVEGRSVRKMAPDQYLGAWRSVNDLRAQMGDGRFQAFLDRIQARISGLPAIETTYLTRAWSVRRR